MAPTTFWQKGTFGVTKSQMPVMSLLYNFGIVLGNTVVNGTPVCTKRTATTVARVIDLVFSADDALLDIPKHYFLRNVGNQKNATGTICCGF